jgi:hypothetical protein
MRSEEELVILGQLLESARERLRGGDEGATIPVAALEQMIVERERLVADQRHEERVRFRA